MIEPTPEQRAIRDEQSLALSILAPAGCGKTESLALRVAGLLERCQIPAWQRVLVLAFSNRARDNVRDRLRSHLSYRTLRSTVTVSNLHGFAARIVKAHSNVIELESDIELPKSDWVSEQCRERGHNYPRATAVSHALRVVKQQPITDPQVIQELLRLGNTDALEIERQRQGDRMLTYDDLLRLAELILANDRVARLYRQHFACVIVDEFQDLTPQQLRIVQRVGYGRTTYAGDVAQGIYSFAGAEPERVLAAIRDETTLELPLTQSHRSSPAVLDAVNALHKRTGGRRLSCSDPASWPGGGLVTGRAFSTVDNEAAWVVEFSQRILRASPSQRIGVITRTGSRRRFVDAAIASSDLAWYRWDDPLMDAATCAQVKRIIGRIDVGTFKEDGRGMAYLAEMADVAALNEPEMRKGVFDALGWMADMINDGKSITEIEGRVKVARSVTLLEAEGVHLLSGHVGKGQQFDWVVVVGLEEGSLPNFNATTELQLREEARVFSVMLSRARHGLAITRSTRVPTLRGGVRDRDASRFLVDLRDSDVLVAGSTADAWLDAVDWSAIANR